MTVFGSATPRARRSIHAAEGPPGALEAADIVLAAAAEYRKGLKGELEHELAPFLDERGRPEDAYRGAIKRIEIRFQRKERRAERDYVDWVLLAVSVPACATGSPSAVGGGGDVLMNPDLCPTDRLTVVRAARGLAGVEEARAELAEDINLNTRLVLERAFLRLAELAA